MTCAIREQVNRILNNSDDDNEIVSAACMYAMEIVARIEYGEDMPGKLEAVKRRRDELEAQQ
ncbi:MAG: hypothetical protein R8L58_02725 [Mariprofundaceae bacterium]